jgi:hypothetical protein
MTIDPRGLTVVEWTDYTGSSLDGYGSIPRLDNPERWQDWAATVLGLGQISVINPPDPYEFDDWVLWATRFNQAIDSKLST